VLLAHLVRKVTFEEAPNQPPMSLVQQLTLASEKGTVVLPRRRGGGGAAASQ